MTELDQMRFAARLEVRLNLYRALETARRAVCCYSNDPCDCKYGLEDYNVLTGDARQFSPSTEVTGCCEVRDMIKKYTGFFPFNRGQSVDEDVERLRASALNGWEIAFERPVEATWAGAIQAEPAKAVDDDRR